MQSAASCIRPLNVRFWQKEDDQTRPLATAALDAKADLPRTGPDGPPMTRSGQDSFGIDWLPMGWRTLRRFGDVINGSRNTFDGTELAARLRKHFVPSSSCSI